MHLELWSPLGVSQSQSEACISCVVFQLRCMPSTLPTLDQSGFPGRLVFQGRRPEVCAKGDIHNCLARR
jgi:hypothetical protein